MRERIIARRYAAALLKVSKELNKIASARKGLAVFAGLLKESRPFYLWLTNDEIPQSRRRQALIDISAAAGIDPIVANFVCVLIENGRIGNIHLAAEEFMLLADEAEGIRRGTLTAADKSSCEGTAKKLEELLGRKMNKTIMLDVREERSLIGGLKLQIKDTLWDASIKRRLEEIKERLCQ